MVSVFVLIYYDKASLNFANELSCSIPRSAPCVILFISNYSSHKVTHVEAFYLSNSSKSLTEKLPKSIYVKCEGGELQQCGHKVLSHFTESMRNEMKRSENRPSRVVSSKSFDSLIVENGDHELHYQSTSVLDLKKASSLNVVVCLFCGDTLELSEILAPILTNDSCSFADDVDLSQSVLIECMFELTKQTIKFTVVAYHDLTKWISCDDPVVHGFVFVYSSQRPASVANVKLDDFI